MSVGRHGERGTTCVFGKLGKGSLQGSLETLPDVSKLLSSSVVLFSLVGSCVDFAFVCLLVAPVSCVCVCVYVSISCVIGFSLPCFVF